MKDTWRSAFSIFLNINPSFHVLVEVLIHLHPYNPCFFLISVITVCFWCLFQGGPGIRGARGDRGEPGVTVCKMLLNSGTLLSCYSLEHLLYFTQLRHEKCSTVGKQNCHMS